LFAFLREGKEHTEAYESTGFAGARFSSVAAYVEVEVKEPRVVALYACPPSGDSKDGWGELFDTEQFNAKNILVSESDGMALGTPDDEYALRHPYRYVLVF
jgi:hypothetical protein